MIPEYEKLIRDEFVSCTTKTLGRIDARAKAAEANNNPFQEYLLPQEAIFWSRFERSYSTSFGQRLVETVSKYVALAYGAEAAETQHSVRFLLSAEERQNIARHLEQLRGNTLGRQREWAADLNDIVVENPERDIDVHVNFDLWFRKAGTDNYISIKTVKPNIDQTEKAKSDLMHTKLAFPQANVFYGLYYNPYGPNRAHYAHNPPFKIFDMINDECVLIGKDYWDTVGQAGAYEKVLSIAESASEESQDLIDKYMKSLGV